ncbi:cation transporting ATPase C-terminal domain-containing protein [Chelativorans xinjiangense]|uniref:cation transporting ATPase C-terminal domain-containing protein n=1 Tax=Chelativorans xinjiangense TaxID=2681485 RepID=UPI001FE2E6E4|nr:cation transporting ATPase C-terminal domain-containing protein [Chelativorans xinjiangense]
MPQGKAGIRVVMITGDHAITAQEIGRQPGLGEKEIFYLFSVRYMHGTSLTWQGILGTPAVLAGVATAQVALTYTPFLQSIFETRPVSLSEGLAVLAVGIALLTVVETEKWVRRRVGSFRCREAV